MKKICYTALIGDYDNLLPPANNPDWDFICYTTEDIEVPGWKMIKVKKWNDPKRQARFIKTIPPFKTLSPCLWIDARFEIVGDLNEFTHAVRNNLAVMRHPVRATVEQEALEIVKIGLDNLARIQKQVNKYSHILRTNSYRLPALGIIYRKKPTNKFNRVWWNEIKNGSHRDQISFNYSAIVTETKFEFLEGGIYDQNNNYYKLHKHKWPRQSPVPI